MFYITLYIFIIILATVVIHTKKDSRTFFVFILLLLTIISIFRYGSGTDYFGYYYHFLTVPNDLSSVVNFDNGFEIGFNLLIYLINKLNLNYEAFIAIVSLFIMYVYYKVINNNSAFKIGSVLIFAANYYPIYVNSALRQGIALSLVVLGIFKYLKKDKKINFSIIVILASLFHISALGSLLFIPLIYLSKTKFNNHYIYILLLILSLLLYLTNFSTYIFSIIPNFTYEPSQANIATVLLRLLFLVYIFNLSKNSFNLSAFEKSLIYIYFIGTVMFFATSNVPILSRLLEYFVISEIIIIPNLIIKQKYIESRVSYFVIIAVIFSVLLVKDLNSFTIQQSYYETGAINYRYTSIFNKSKIYQYRQIPY